MFSSDYKCPFFLNLIFTKNSDFEKKERKNKSSRFHSFPVRTNRARIPMIPHLNVNEQKKRSVSGEKESGENSNLEIRVVIHQDGHYSHVRDMSVCSSNNVPVLKPHLSFVVKASIMHVVVVSFGENQLLPVRPFVNKEMSREGKDS